MVGINLTYLFICVITVFSLFQNSRCFIYIRIWNTNMTNPSFLITNF
ncbi:hypothetical protein HMPREF1333_00182 [Enterococcus faecalis ERV37]|nr:hypothetical protein HMPREF1333_00182 [Enterococcus faecalis ERV37]